MEGEICQHEKKYGHQGSNARRWHARCNQEWDFGMSGWQLCPQGYISRASRRKGHADIFCGA
jgi:hypothetical protein